MDYTDKKVQDHLDTAKEELKSAAEGVLEKTKADISEKIDLAIDKVNEVVGNVAASVGAVADKVQEEVSKKDAVTK